LLVKVVISVKLGNTWLKLVLYLMLVILILPELVALLPAKLHVLELVLG